MITRFRMSVAVVTAAIAAAALGCSLVQPYHSVESVAHVTNLQVKKHPLRLNDPVVPGRDRMVLIDDDAAWAAYWGEGEAPPKVDFTKNQLLVVVTWMASGGPGSLEMHIVGYRDNKKEKTRTVYVTESVSGSWDAPGGLSRAYDIAAIPRSENQLVLKWHKSTAQGVKETQEEPIPFTGEAPGPS